MVNTASFCDILFEGLSSEWDFSTGMIFMCNQLNLDSTAFNISPITSFSSAGFPVKTN